MNTEPGNLALQTMHAELTQRALDAEFDELYDERGMFTRKRIKTREYWYYKRGEGGKKHYTYVGPVGDKAINERVKKFDAIKANYRQRREMVRALLAAGMQGPDPVASELIEALSRAGFFRLRGVLVGTLAFQCYGGILGTRLTGTSLQTSDADLAQFYDVSHLVGDSMPPILEVLRKVDPTFRAIPNVFYPGLATRFTTSTGYLVEFLTPNRGSDDNQGRPAEMPALGGASALPLRYLDFLIRDPIRSVVLYKGGIPVRIPSPERYAVHKLIVAVRRAQEPSKASKDVAQAEQLIRACLSQRSFLLFETWVEACDRGPSWRDHLKRGRSMLPEALRDAFILSLQTHGWSESRLTERRPRKNAKLQTKRSEKRRSGSSKRQSRTAKRSGNVPRPG
jgi:hypothetical protein